MVSNIDKKDAVLFTALCRFSWNLGVTDPVIFNVQDEIYNQEGLTFSSINHLADIGLISFNNFGYEKSISGQNLMPVFYYGKLLILKSKAENLKLKFGKVIFTNVGRELAPICGAVSADGFLEYCIEEWRKQGFDIKE